MTKPAKQTLPQAESGMESRSTFQPLFGHQHDLLRAEAAQFTPDVDELGGRELTIGDQPYLPDIVRGGAIWAATMKKISIRKTMLIRAIVGSGFARFDDLVASRIGILPYDLQADTGGAPEHQHGVDQLLRSRGLVDRQDDGVEIGRRLQPFDFSLQCQGGQL